MPERNMASVSGSMGGNSYIAGDNDPSDFSYQNALSRQDLLSLFLRNPKIQKATVWFAAEMLRERWEFKDDQAVEGQKHGLPHTFDTFIEWLEWNGFMQEALKGLMWSLLFGDAILVFYDGKEKIAMNDVLPNATNFVSCKAYYPHVGGNGYVIQEVDPVFGTPQKYKIELHNHKASKSMTFYVDKDRVVRFPAPQRELKYSGTSIVSAIAHDCLAQEQIKRAVVTQANNLSGGILAIKAANADEQAVVSNAIGDTLTHLRRVYFKNAEEIDQLVKIIIPDLKIDQLEKLNKVIQTDIATGMDMSISVLEGSPQGALSSAAFDTFNTYTKVKQLQSHYKRPMEECFFKFGKQDTTFTWNDPSPMEKKEDPASPTPTEPDVEDNKEEEMTDE